jgi:gamma-glutamylcyclotransferase
VAILPNFKLVFVGWSRNWRGGKASVKPFRGERVRGAIYEVTEECLKRLDKHEDGYARFNVTAFDEDNEPVSAITYIKSGQLEDSPPSKEYLTIIQQGYQDWGIF